MKVYSQEVLEFRKSLQKNSRHKSSWICCQGAAEFFKYANKSTWHWHLAIHNIPKEYHQHLYPLLQSPLVQKSKFSSRKEAAEYVQGFLKAACNIDLDISKFQKGKSCNTSYSLEKANYTLYFEHFFESGWRVWKTPTGNQIHCSYLHKDLGQWIQNGSGLKGYIKTKGMQAHYIEPNHFLFPSLNQAIQAYLQTAE